MLGLQSRPSPKTITNSIENLNLKKIQDNPLRNRSTVMIVEDDNDNRELIYYMLKNKGYNVVTFSNALDALKYLESNKVDIIVSDIMMPKMDGIEFCSTVRKKYSGIYFIMLTAKSEKNDVSYGLNIGADDYITKPFDFMEFSARVKVGERIILNQKKLTYLNDKLEQIADTDSLTKLKNRRYFSTEATKELNRAKRYGHTLALFMIDIDNFKQINDKYGHLTGDLVLKKIAKIISLKARESDIICRYGGEEFVMVIPETDPKKASYTAEKIRKLVEKTKITIDDKEIDLTISIGIALNTPKNMISLKELVDFADRALYSAKNSGKNKTVIHKWFEKTL
ncbi:MAG: diguanylate cyclase [Cyanobacteriota bacterium]